MTVTLEQLAEMVADLAQEIAYGANGHIRPASQNKSLAVLNALRPQPEPVAEEVAPADLCGKVQDKDDDDSPVCILKKGHAAGHQFGHRPSEVAA